MASFVASFFEKLWYLREEWRILKELFFPKNDPKMTLKTKKNTVNTVFLESRGRGIRTPAENSHNPLFFSISYVVVASFVASNFGLRTTQLPPKSPVNGVFD